MADYKPRQQVKTWLSAKPVFMGMTVIDAAWATHLFVACWMGWNAFHGNNPLAFTGLDAPAYKIGVIAMLEGARAILSMANVWEEEINWTASTGLVLLLMTMGGASPANISPTLSLQAASAVGLCNYYNPVLKRDLNEQERTECDTMRGNGTMTKAWAKNCGCGG